MRRVVELFFIGVIALSFAGALQAQSTNATLTGRVSDASKSGIVDARVTLINTGKNLHYEGMTNDSGTYYVADLPAGTYRMEVEKIGFKTVIKPDIILHVQDALEVNFEMALGSLAETVTVEAGAPTLQLTTSSIGAVVNSTTVRELPLNGRSWTDLTTLQPGVEQIQTQPSFTSGGDRGNRGFGQELSISGARPTQNNYRLDGISLNDYSNAGPGSVLGGNLGVDAIQEFSVVTTNYSAEYGKTSGGVVNAISRSGTNEFHGSAYEFLRNSALDARNFFDGPTIPPFKRNQFGASLGGPIQKGRTFIFGDFEAIRQAKGISVLDVVPSQAAKAGTLCSVPGTPPACIPTTVSVDPSAQKFFTFFPLPNKGLVPGGNGDTGFFTFAGNQVVNENFVTARIDHKFSEKDSMFGSFMFDRTPFTGPDALRNIVNGDLTVRQLYTIEETHTFSPNLVNTARFGFNRVAADANNGISAINPAAVDKSLASDPGFNASEVFIGGGITQFVGGLGVDPFNVFRWNSFQGDDDAFLAHGTHSLKFGFAVERDQLNMLAGLVRGRFIFNTFSDFLTNNPVQFVSHASANPSHGFRQTLFGAYLQDDWRWRPNLTLNLGMRYEMSTVPTQVQGKFVNLIHMTDLTPQVNGSPFSNPTLRNFEPKVGFAWDPLKTGRTAVRGGFGMFDVLPMIYQFAVAQSLVAPFTSRGIINSPPIDQGDFFTGGFPLLTPNTFGSQHIDQNPARSYVMQWNLNIQHQITPSVTAQVAYVGSRGVHLPWHADDADLVIPTLTSVGYLWPSPIGSGTKINPNFGSIHGNFFKANSFYDALEVGVTKVMTHGLQFQGSFTWGKSIDDGSTTGLGDQFSNSVSSLNWFDKRLTRALSDFNVGRTLVLSVIWELPQRKSLFGPRAWLVNGWELGSIFKANDGVPFTPTWGTGGDPAGTLSSDAYAFPDRLSGPGCATLTNPGNPNHYVKTQCFTVPTAPSPAFYAANCDPTHGTFPQCFNLRGNAGRNIVNGPGLVSMDFSMFKNNYIRRGSENFNVQFRAEFFNILNHPNFNVIRTAAGEADIFDATGSPIPTSGQLISTTTTAREIQFAVKFIW
jgi:hypothetical protein